MALDLSNLKTLDGKPIQFHLEDEEAQKILDKYLTQETLIAWVSQRASWQEGLVHVLVNKLGGAYVVDETSYKRWLQNPSWGHATSGLVTLAALIGAVLLLGDLSDDDDFALPTSEQVELYRDDPRLKKLGHTTDCRLCLSRLCPIRHGDFDEQALMEALAAVE